MDVAGRLIGMPLNDGARQSDRRLVSPGTKMGQAFGQLELPALRIDGAQPLGAPDMLDGEVMVAVVAARPSAAMPGLGIVWVQRQRAVDEVEAGRRLAAQIGERNPPAPSASGLSGRRSMARRPSRTPSSHSARMSTIHCACLRRV
jgi:hypothetical protein